MRGAVPTCKAPGNCSPAAPMQAKVAAQQEQLSKAHNHNSLLQVCPAQLSTPAGCGSANSQLTRFVVSSREWRSSILNESSGTKRLAGVKPPWPRRETRNSRPPQRSSSWRPELPLMRRPVEMGSCRYAVRSGAREEGYLTALLPAGAAGTAGADGDPPQADP